jgi:hypothetical protein
MLRAEVEMSGRYTEKLPCGGELIVEPKSWMIQYYFSGPDGRYRGTFVRIPSARVEEYIEAYESNWALYEKMKSLGVQAGTIEKPGAAGMVVRVGGHWPGVSIESYHMPLKTREEIDRVVSSYRLALGKARDIQDLLQTIA